MPACSLQIGFQVNTKLRHCFSRISSLRCSWLAFRCAPLSYSAPGCSLLSKPRTDRDLGCRLPTDCNIFNVEIELWSIQRASCLHDGDHTHERGADVHPGELGRRPNAKRPSLGTPWQAQCACLAKTSSTGALGPTQLLKMPCVRLYRLASGRPCTSWRILSFSFLPF